MKHLFKPFSRLAPKTALVIGDFMLDAYTFGKVRRISPEAPVPIVHSSSESELPGGAGNVVLNLLSLGMVVYFAGRKGKDVQSQKIEEKLISEGAKSLLVEDTGFKMPVKHRIIADNQQVVRIDYEEIHPVSSSFIPGFLSALEKAVAEVDIVALSDYGKGLFTSEMTSNIIKLVKKYNKPILTDPKGLDYHKYKGSTLIKPNLKEAYEAAHLPSNTPLETTAKKLLEITQADCLFITKGESGISLFNHEGQKDFPVKSKQVKDVTGAGDTVLAMVVASIASGLTLDDAAHLANVAASIAIEKVGCARITLHDLAKRLLELDSENKIFDHEHEHALSHALKGEDYHWLEISHEESLSPALYQKIKQYQVKPLIVNLKQSPEKPELLEFLKSMKEVNYVFIGEHFS